MSATPKRATRAPKREAMSRAVFTSRWCDPYLPVQNGLTTEGEIISQISRHPSARVVCFVRTRLQVNKSPKKSRARRSGIAREERVFRECHLIYLFTRRSSPVTRHSRFSSHGPSSHSKGQYPTREARSGRSINVARSILAKCVIFRLFARTLHRQKISIVATFRDLYRPETNLSRTSNAGRSSRPRSLPETRVSGTARASPPPAGR